MNYRIHTDAIKENLIPPELTPYQISITYASEADVLNVALFGERLQLLNKLVIRQLKAIEEIDTDVIRIRKLEKK